MNELKFEELLDAGCHFGHLKRKWNPKMAPYIFKEHNGIHVIDLQKTIAKADEAAAALRQMAKSGKKVLFVATKKQAKEVVAEMAKSVDMPFVTERWPGGMLTNFQTIRKAVKKMNSLDQLMHDKDFNNISKRERLQVQRERAKLAVAEARRLNIPTFALVDTNTNPDLIDFPIPANDDASKSIAAILKHMCEAIQEGLNERALDKDAQTEEEAPVAEAAEAPVEKKTRARRPRKSEEAPKAETEEAPKAE